MKVKLLRKDLTKDLKKFHLTAKWQKAKKLFEANLRHPSLNTELLEPKWRGIYSFRLDKKYRALFFIANGKAEIFKITKHCRKS